MSENNKKKTFSKLPPNLIKEDNFVIENEGDYEGREIIAGDFSKQDLTALDFKDCSFKNCKFNQAKVGKLSLVNVSFVDCDFANMEVEELYAKKVDWGKCRMTGFLANEGVLNDLSFRDCLLKFAQFRFAKLRYINFSDCLLNEADFYSAEFYQVDFSQCDLGKVEMCQTRHGQTDLRTSIITGMNVNIESLTGITVDYTQAYDLIWLLGLNIV